MKVKAYIKIGKNEKKNSFVVKSSMKSDPMPIFIGDYNRRVFPTITFPVVFNLPDDAFDDNPITEINVELQGIKISGAIMAEEMKEAIKRTRIREIKE